MKKQEIRAEEQSHDVELAITLAVAGFAVGFFGAMTVFGVYSWHSVTLPAVWYLTLTIVGGVGTFSSAVNEEKEALETEIARMKQDQEIMAGEMGELRESSKQEKAKLEEQVSELKNENGRIKQRNKELTNETKTIDQYFEKVTSKERNEKKEELFAEDAEELKIESKIDLDKFFS